MLYIASALTPTPLSHTVKVTGLTAPDVLSLVVAKPDRIEVWNATAQGLEYVAELRVWGTVIGLASVSLPDTRPHLLVLTAPPSAGLHVVGFEAGALVITASEALRPPTPVLRRQEYFTGVVACGTTAVASIWTGIVSVFELEGEKAKDMKRRGGDERRVVFKPAGPSNINIREHNLLDLAFLDPGPTSGSGSSPGTVLAFLWMSEYMKISVQPRLLSGTTFTDLAPATDVMNPLDFPFTKDDTLDYEALPFSCPAGRQLLPIPSTGGGTRHFLVIGDEHSVMYEVSSTDKHSHPSSSPRAASARRSSHSQDDAGGRYKKRKSSASGRSVPTTDVENSWTVRPVWRLAQGFGTILASTVLDSHSSGGSVLLGDEYGRLTVLGWEFEGETVRIGKIYLGTASPPRALTYIDNGHVFVSSACGDSLLVSLNIPAMETKSKGKGKSCGAPPVESSDGGAWNIELAFDTSGDTTVAERWMNVAPVKDFVVVEEEDGRVSHLVVASGAGNANSLRIVRSGVGFDDALSVEGIAGVERMWALTGGATPTLLLSFWGSTALVRLEPDIAPITASELVTALPTLAAGLVNDGNVLVQVTSHSVQLWSDIVTGTSVGAFIADEGKEIVAASVTADNIVAAFRDGTLIVWKADCSLEQITTFKLAREAATVDISADGSLIAASDWNGRIDLFETTATEASFMTDEAAYAASLLFVPGRLLAGLSDGTFVAYDLGSKARTQSSLGSRPLTLVPVEVASGDDTVFAAGVSERLSLLFESHGHIEVSSSGKKGVVAAASVTTASLGPCLALATKDGLCFSRLTSLKKLQVQTLDLGVKSAMRLATVPDLKMIAAGTVTQTLDPLTGDIMQVSGVEIRNPTTLEQLAEFQLPFREAVTSVNSTLLHGKRYIAVGTAQFASDEMAHEASLDDVGAFIQAERGRLILLEPLLLDGTDDDPRWVLDVVAELDAPAPVLDSATIHNFLAIATAAKVSILSFECRAEQDGKPRGTAIMGKLVERAKCTFAFDASFLAVSHSPDGDTLVVGDSMRSILVLDVDPESGSIKWDQRDMSSHAVRALAEVRDDGPGVIISDDHSNLLTFRLKTDIEPAATIGLHEDVTRFRRGAFASTAPDILQPDLVFATANGRLGIIGELGASATRTLDDLQRNMSSHALGPGGLTWKSFRRAGSLTVPKETRGFIDGDYLQRFLSLGPDDMQAALKGSGSAHEQVCKLADKGTVAASERDVVGLLETVAGMH